MLWILIGVYLWAGVTVLFALWLFETVGQAMNGLLPEEKHLKAKLRGNIIGMIFIFALWPIVLPIWVFTEMRSNAEA